MNLMNSRGDSDPSCTVLFHSLLGRRVILALICMGLTGLILLPSCSRRVPDSRGRQRATLFLDARSGWQSAGVECRKGDTLHIDCYGTWAVAPENESQRWPDAGPEGHGMRPGEMVHIKGDPKKELPGVPFGALLGKISDTVFAIGDRKTMVAPADGELYLVINDYPFFRHDNRGGLTVVIEGQAARAN